jgi:hypothetical protein
MILIYIICFILYNTVHIQTGQQHFRDDMKNETGHEIKKNTILKKANVTNIPNVKNTR